MDNLKNLSENELFVKLAEGMFSMFTILYLEQDKQYLDYGPIALDKYRELKKHDLLGLIQDSYSIAQALSLFLIDNFQQINDDELEEIFNDCYFFYYQFLNSEQIDSDNELNARKHLILIIQFVHQQDFYFHSMVSSLIENNFYIVSNFVDVIAKARKAFKILNTSLLNKSPDLREMYPSFELLLKEYEGEFNNKLYWPPISDSDPILIDIFAEKIHNYYFDYLSNR